MCDILCDLKKVKYVIFYVKKYQICYILCDLVPKNGWIWTYPGEQLTTRKC
jgi:hypothetical protein